MIIIQGKGVSGGIARGRLSFFRRYTNDIPREDGEGAEREKARFAAAQEISVTQLERLSEKCRREIGENEALLFETHAMLARDGDFVAGVHEAIELDGCRAEYAVHLAG